MAALVLIFAIALGLAVLLWGLGAYRDARGARRDEPEWWPEFERQFREYAARRGSPGPARPKRHATGRPPRGARRRGREHRI